MRATSVLRTAILLPLGVAIAAPVRTKAWSLGVFLPFLDVGTLASARLGDDEAVSDAPEVGFAQVFAPGVFAVLGIGQTFPLSLGAGYQQVPKLRETSAGARTARRFAFFAGVDLPMFTF